MKDPDLRNLRRYRRTHLEAGLKVSQQESVWAIVLFLALAWALISAIAATVSVRYEMRWGAWVWTASFLVSSLVAAYSFWRAA
jgi:NhaP-type Na+/H+ or K+/H+ antiporter